ncbi:hypothetical protein M426DRAFT_25581 [Hypoxylon sp. CI-4A]|nr:hypothetical protein M426DRAFT_25581 [Hypoxylon sp. CI-4A]
MEAPRRFKILGAPATVLIALVMGVVFSICHDRLYASFNGQPVSSRRQQRVVTSAGTAFAFLVRACFTISTATAFSQQIFHSVKQRYETINNLDILFGLLGNVFYMGNVKLWLRYPALIILALITWCMPLAAVFTPGTIQVEPSVRNFDVNPLRPTQPQQSWIGSQKFASCQLDDTAMSRAADGHVHVNAVCTGPSGDLYSTTISSLSQQGILPIPPPDQNSSYALTFAGPALNCTQLSESDALAMNTSVVAARSHSYLPGMHTILGGVNGQMSPDTLSLKYNAWQLSDCFNLTNPDWHNGTTNSLCYNRNTNNTDYFFFASGSPQETMVLLTCGLHNSTYDVEFTYENLEQRINVKSVALGDQVIPDSDVDYDLPDYGNVVYTAVMNAFNNVVLSAALNDTSVGSGTGGIQYYEGVAQVTGLRDLIEGKKALTGAYAKTMIEQMFQNITISTMSSPALRLPEADAKEINVKTWRSSNIYVYDPRNLFIAYGTAFGLTTLCVVWAFYVVLYHHRQVSYDSKFSTMLRATASSEIYGAVALHDRKGGEPTSKDLLKIKLKYYSDEGSEKPDGFIVQPGLHRLLT